MATYGNATPADVMISKTFTSDSGKGLTGTRTNFPDGGWLFPEKDNGLTITIEGTTITMTPEEPWGNFYYVYLYNNTCAMAVTGWDGEVGTMNVFGRLKSGYGAAVYPFTIEDNAIIIDCSSNPPYDMSIFYGRLGHQPDYINATVSTTSLKNAKPQKVITFMSDKEAGQRIKIPTDNSN